jgi:uncharacterized membrane protein YphA (DoxX/SURF4 family)
VTKFPDRAWALLFARLVVGLIFFMAGAWKVSQLGPLEHARKYFLPFSDTFLPCGRSGSLASSFLSSNSLPEL